MIKRFSLYGFLKNQRYFEPFLILVFLEKGLTFFEIGLLIGFREVCINLLEVPSGAAADLYGRRRSMIFSFGAYILSFATFALSQTVFGLIAAMFLFALGDVFRTGTHKAMIFDWLKHENRIEEKTRVYGYTRSWSKMGSALSVLIAAGLVFYSGKYSHIFWFSIPPYLLAILNFWGYPRYLDGDLTAKLSLRQVLNHFREGFKLTWNNLNLRRLVIESMNYEGLYKAIKDYLQPVIHQTALALPIFLAGRDSQRAAVLIGAVYFLLHFLSGLASRHSHFLAQRFRTEVNASGFLWLLYSGFFLILTIAFWFNWHALMITCFVGLAMAQNFWRPLLVSRFDDYAPPEMGATILSIESQSKSVATMVFAPILGFLVDQLGFWPLGVLGMSVSILVLILFYQKAESDGLK